MSVTLPERVRERRDSARQAAAEILTRAADDGRDLTPDDLAEHQRHVDAEREAADELDRLRDEQIAELRAGTARAGGRPVLTRAEADIARAFKSAIFAKNRRRRSSSAPTWPTSGPTTCPRWCTAAPAT